MNILATSQPQPFLSALNFSQVYPIRFSSLYIKIFINSLRKEENVDCYQFINDFIHALFGIILWQRLIASDDSRIPAFCLDIFCFSRRYQHRWVRGQIVEQAIIILNATEYMATNWRVSRKHIFSIVNLFKTILIFWVF